MTDVGSLAEDLVDNFLSIADTLIFTHFVPLFQSFVPGSGNSIWSTAQYPILMLFIILVAAYIVTRNMK